MDVGMVVHVQLGVHADNSIPHEGVARLTGIIAYTRNSHAERLNGTPLSHDPMGVLTVKTVSDVHVERRRSRCAMVPPSSVECVVDDERTGGAGTPRTTRAKLDR